MQKCSPQAECYMQFQLKAQLYGRCIKQSKFRDLWEYLQIFTVSAEQILTHYNTVFVLIVKSKL